MHDSDIAVPLDLIKVKKGFIKQIYIMYILNKNYFDKQLKIYLFFIRQ